MFRLTGNTRTIGAAVLTLFALPTFVQAEVTDSVPTWAIELIWVDARKSLIRTSVRIQVMTKVTYGPLLLTR